MTPEELQDLRERMAKRNQELGDAIRAADPARAGKRRKRRPVPADGRARMAAARRAQIARDVLNDPNAPHLRRLRVSRGLTLGDLAIAASVSAATVQRAETDADRISRLTWLRLAVALNVDPDEIKPEPRPDGM
jgi:Helix-turn-helix domain